jgi:hypothetical protein
LLDALRLFSDRYIRPLLVRFLVVAVAFFVVVRIFIGLVIVLSVVIRFLVRLVVVLGITIVAVIFSFGAVVCFLIRLVIVLGIIIAVVAFSLGAVVRFLIRLVVFGISIVVVVFSLGIVVRFLVRLVVVFGLSGLLLGSLDGNGLGLFGRETPGFGNLRLPALGGGVLGSGCLSVGRLGFRLLLI